MNTRNLPPEPSTGVPWFNILSQTPVIADWYAGKNVDFTSPENTSDLFPDCWMADRYFTDLWGSFPPGSRPVPWFNAVAGLQLIADLYNGVQTVQEAIENGSLVLPRTQDKTPFCFLTDRGFAQILKGV